jgi:hypothetical protein
VSIKEELKKYKRARAGFILSVILLLAIISFWFGGPLSLTCFFLSQLIPVALVFILAFHHKPPPLVWIFISLTIIILIVGDTPFWINYLIPEQIHFRYESFFAGISFASFIAGRISNFGIAALLFISCKRYSSPFLIPLLIISVTYLLAIASLPIDYFNCLRTVEFREIQSFGIAGVLERYAEYKIGLQGGLWESILNYSFLLENISLAIAFLVMTYAVKKPPFVCGVYEGKEDDESVRFGILANGTYELYRDGKGVEKGKWTPVQDEIHITVKDPDVGTVVNINKINEDDSLTEIAEIIDGERKDALEEEQFTYNKV